ncbi:hypothetical protein DSL72_007132 [Monilinia vaccinii-corymbosi]|uniref:Uncharacterized protein n=1 Tax=Monilinia vaccinii-corymbosi TaxID=61207 RepID=A0A8A3PKZ5_9HELO|nr:hypothetical protein DSL72_007132 [Monilinia vaccinii-corymbosi]
MTLHFTSFLKSAADVLGNATKAHHNRQNQLASQSSANGSALASVHPRSSYNPLQTTSSTHTNPSENLPPTPKIRAVDEVPDLEIDAPNLFGGTGITNYRGVDTGPVAVPVAVPGMGSLVRQQGMVLGQGIVLGRQRAFTIPRKPLPAKEAREREEGGDFEREYEDVEVRGRALVREERGQEHGGSVEFGRGERFKGGQGFEHQDFTQGGKFQEQEPVESIGERFARLERERSERAVRDLNHENPLRSHPIHPTTITTGMAPTTSSIYSNNSNSLRSRAFRRSYTVPINGFNFAAMGGVGAGPCGAVHDLHGMHGMGTMERGSAAQRYASSTAAPGSRTGSFLRRASIGWRGIGFSRSNSGGLGATGVADADADAVMERPGTVDSESEAMIHEIMSAEAERRRSHRQSMILPKFEWEDEFLGGRNGSY